MVLAFLNVLVRFGHSRMVGYSILTLYFGPKFRLYHAHIYTQAWWFCFDFVVLFCNQCDLLKDMIIVYVFFFKRISFSSSWNFGSNLKLISAWLRNPVLSVTCFMSFELYYVGIWFLFCLLFFACCFTSGWVMIDWGSSLHALNAIYFLWITWLLQLRTFNKLESMYANRILLLLTFFGYRSKINAYIAMCMCVSEFVCACLQSV